MLSVVMLKVGRYPECHYGERCCADCRQCAALSKLFKEEASHVNPCKQHDLFEETRQTSFESQIERFQQLFWKKNIFLQAFLDNWPLEIVMQLRWVR
jgi:hypothetical protein